MNAVTRPFFLRAASAQADELLTHAADGWRDGMQRRPGQPGIQAIEGGQDGQGNGSDTPASRNAANASIAAIPSGCAGAIPQLPALLFVDYWSLAEQEQPLSQRAQYALLDATEKARLASLRRPQDGQRYLAAHAGLRQRLARWLETSPATLRLHAAEFGKPVLSDYPWLHFNLSHSDGHAMLALADAPVGVDLERLIDSRDLSAALMQQILAPTEMPGLLGMCAHEQAAKLTAHWVAKEAVMKATGLGVRLAPTDILVDGVTGQVRLEGEGRQGQTHDWTCHRIAAPKGHLAAIALPAPRSDAELL